MEDRSGTVDVSGNEELLALAEGVRDSSEPILLCKDGQVLAKIVPVPAPRPRRERGLKSPVLTPEQEAAFLASAGGWADVDVDEFLRQNRISRDRSRPPVQL